MEKEDFRECLRQFVWPVILDHNVAAHKLAAALRHKYGILSTLCGSRQSLLDLLNPHVSFLSLNYISNPILSAEQLVDFAHTYDELILLLIPMNEQQEQFLSAYEDKLSCYYILSDPKAVFDCSPLDSF